MSENVEIEVHVLIGEGGEYVVAKDRDELADLYAAEHGAVPAVTRVFAVQLSVPAPSAILIKAAVDGTAPVKITVE